MKTVAVIVPGIMGTELVLPNGEVVWPPKVIETLFGYRRIDKLQDPALRPTRIIQNVSCVDFYRPLQSLLAQLAFGASGDKMLVEHPYDWRLDLFDLAEGLAAKLDTAAVDADRIVIVAHSMGGLISRLMLETPNFRNRPWFPKIDSFLALATPHNGAPLALARVLGLDSALGISGADFKTLAANPAYPSGYQLLPAPGEDACWNVAAGAELAPLDYYDDTVAHTLGMSPALVARVRAVHEALNSGTVPDHVRYFYFSGTGHKTVTRVNIDGATAQMVITPDAGDGTVPLWSALPRRVQKQVVVNDHANVFRGNAFKRVFFRLFGADAGTPLEAPSDAAFKLALSLQRPIFEEGTPIEAVLSADVPFTKLQGDLVFEARTEDDTVGPVAARVPISYSGPAVATLAVSIEASLTAGFYELRYEGDRAQEDRVVFALSRTN
ncbi:lipase/acyltransferase domain-containing protein [Sulfitobacter pacificus]|uniref:lipase/acyltransferase domain-containing protein n=1 Tax=Sulfitobacter pacificus TaxID=1499314 RepID=UPI00310938BC